MIAPQPAPHELDWPTLLTVLRPLLAANTAPVYLVGGAVRDAYLRRPVHDLDFATADDGCKVARSLANKLNGAYYPLDIERGVGRVILDYNGERFNIDIARFRGDSLADDLLYRDFTMNALAVPMDSDLQQIIDPMGGIVDLLRKWVRRCTPQSISTDPVRALRAVRQANALKLMIESETRKDIHQYGPHIASASVERVRDEFMSMLGGARPHAALRALDSLGLLRLLIPEVDAMRGVTQSPPHTFDVWEHTLNVVEKLDGVITTISPARTDDSAADTAYGLIVYLLDRYRRHLNEHLDTPLPNDRSARALLVLAALLHDCAKPLTRAVDEDGRIHFYQHEVMGADIALERGTALRLSNEEVTRLSEIVRHHMRPMHLRDVAHISRRTIYRFWNAAGKNGVDVCILTLADYLGMVGVTLTVQDWVQHLETVSILLDGYFNQREAVVMPPPLVTGYDLMAALGLRPGPQVGRLLALISEGQAAGEIQTAEQALELARAKLDAPEDSAE